MRIDPLRVLPAAYCGSKVHQFPVEKDLGISQHPVANEFLESDLVCYGPIGGNITIPEESAKYVEIARRFYKVKLSA